MSDLQKSSLKVDGNDVRMSMPFAKVDEAKRLVSGYATLDNLDTQGDIVLAEASKAAFSRARGNIREMHQPLAVGKMVDFREEEFLDDDGELYRAIYVTARVSEGAEDTWKKVLDGTLTGFSIGGEINDASNEFVKEAGRTVRFIKDYDLTELSLVDNPANQKANVLSIQKVNGSVKLDGPVTEVVVENVFICPNEDGTVVIKESTSETCPICSAAMENAGWFEAGGNRAEKVRSVVTKFRGTAAKEAAPGEGGVEEVGLLKKSVDAPVPDGKPVDVVNPGEKFENGEKIEEAAKSEDEKAEEVTDSEEKPEEVVDSEESEISKKIDELHAAVKETLEESQAHTNERLATLEKKIGEATEQFSSKASEIEEKLGTIGKNLEASKARVADLEARLEKFNSADAVKKSAGFEKSAEPVVQKESFWTGAFSD